MILSPLLISYISILSQILYLATSIAPYAFLKLAEGINEHLAQICLILLSNAATHSNLQVCRGQPWKQSQMQNQPISYKVQNMVNSVK